MSTEHENWEDILTDLVAARAREEELPLGRRALLDVPASSVPEHVTSAFAQAKQVFDRDAAEFLAATPPWGLGHEMPIRMAQDIEGAPRVEDLLARISYGIPPWLFCG